MINVRFNKRALAFFTSGVCAFSLYGCSSSSESKESVVSINSVSSDFLDSESVSSDLYTTVLTTENTECYYFEKDDLVLNYYDDAISDIGHEESNESFLDKGKKYFIYSIDFLFYDGEINGVKFSDLTMSAKEQLLKDIVTIDDLICSKFPNYKETISNDMGVAFNKVMEIVRAGCKNINDFSRDKLGDENYNKISDFKNLFFETAFGDWDRFTGVVDTGKQKVKDWYENFRKNNQSTTEELK